MPSHYSDGYGVSSLGSYSSSSSRLGRDRMTLDYGHHAAAGGGYSSTSLSSSRYGGGGLSGGGGSSSGLYGSGGGGEYSMSGGLSSALAGDNRGDGLMPYPPLSSYATTSSLGSRSGASSAIGSVGTQGYGSSLRSAYDGGGGSTRSSYTDSGLSRSSYDAASSRPSYGGQGLLASSPYEKPAASLSSYDSSALSRSTYDTGSALRSSYDAGASRSTYDLGASRSSYDAGASRSSYDAGSSRPTYGSSVPRSSYDSGLPARSSYLDSGVSRSSYDAGGLSRSAYDSAALQRPAYDDSASRSSLAASRSAPAYGAERSYAGSSGFGSDNYSNGAGYGGSSGGSGYRDSVHDNYRAPQGHGSGSGGGLGHGSSRGYNSGPGLLSWDEGAGSQMSQRPGLAGSQPHHDFLPTPRAPGAGLLGSPPADDRLGGGEDGSRRDLLGAVNQLQHMDNHESKLALNILNAVLKSPQQERPRVWDDEPPAAKMRRLDWVRHTPGSSPVPLDLCPPPSTSASRRASQTNGISLQC
ncbi:hypothetical protein GWK47_054221 [Chionoecetes opilio]|uniref:Uncharacterized protein n=1 Tax=Chionoecetes opilio TaxID=41210 RepID=A0A8J5CQ44_CHIOP|nr:hypothetical protein GWK47_054221 [Chionoecetes opilio]